jgi:hypothetical protein
MEDIVFRCADSRQDAASGQPRETQLITMPARSGL